MSAGRPSRPPGRGEESARESATAIAASLGAAGFTAYFAGGCVRDRLLGLEPQDFDVATDATPEQISKVFPSARGVGASFGVMLVRRGGHTVEVATFRRDGEYIDGRRPSRVHFGSAEQDARRRDFTINGLFEEPSTGRVIDFVDGVEDIRRRILRAIGSAEERLAEDRLRMLRAVRFAARFELAVDDEVVRAIRAHGAELMGVSRERIGMEIRRVLLHASRGRAVRMVEEFGLAPAILGEAAADRHGDRTRRLPPEVDLSAALACWMLDRSDAPGPVDAARVRRWVASLVLSNAEADSLAEALRLHRLIGAEWRGADRAVRKRMAAMPDFRAALEVVRTEDPALAEEVAAEVRNLAAEGLAPAPLVTGDDLIALGLRPGPSFRAVLDALYDRQLRGELPHREAALAAARSMTGT